MKKSVSNETTAGTEGEPEETTDMENQTNGNRVERATIIENPSDTTAGTSTETTAGNSCLSCAALQSKIDNLLHEVSELRESLMISQLHASVKKDRNGNSNKSGKCNYWFASEGVC